MTHLNNFIKYKGYNIGKSLFEENQENLVKLIIEKCKTNNCNLVLYMNNCALIYLIRLQLFSII